MHAATLLKQAGSQKLCVRAPKLSRHYHALVHTHTPRMTSVRAAATSTSRQLLSVAPMMDWTDVHYRQMARLISKHTWLWTEMVVDKTILHTSTPERFLWFPQEQRPLVLQMGGSNPNDLAAATRVAAEWGYDEINLNCGCPSDRVAGAGCFGASLMLEPELVGDCMRAMGDAAGGQPVTVKCRLGVDQDDSYEALQNFVRIVSERSSVTHFIIHARKAFLKGLNPQQNRSIPPLRYEWLFGLKRDFPHLCFSLNGGIQSPYEALAYINHIPDHSELDAERSKGNSGVNGSENGASKNGSGENGQSVNGCHTNGVSDSHGVSTSAVENGVGVSRGAQKRGPEELQGNGASFSAVEGVTDAVRADAANTNTAGASAAGTQQGEGETAARSESHAGASTSQQGSGSDGLTAPMGRAAVEGVMIGRAAYNDPWGVLGNADRAVFGAEQNAATSRRQVLQDYCKYAESVVGSWGCKADGHREPSVRAVFKPLLNLFHGEKGSKRWKQEVDSLLKADPPSVEHVLAHSLHLIDSAVLDSPPRMEPSMEDALKGRLSATPAPKIALRPLPKPLDRAGNNQDPNGVDSKRLCVKA